MPRRASSPPPTEPFPEDETPLTPDGEGARAVPDLGSLGIAGIGRRQVAMILGALLAIWIIGVFARQVGDASAASTRAETIAAANEELRHDVAARRRELAFIQRQEYFVQQARAYGLGSAREIPFSLAADAPPLPDDAPGSAAARVGGERDRATPLDRWLELLFGPG
jgi:hypothetical protein